VEAEREGKGGAVSELDDGRVRNHLGVSQIPGADCVAELEGGTYCLGPGFTGAIATPCASYWAGDGRLRIVRRAINRPRCAENLKADVLRALLPNLRKLLFCAAMANEENPVLGKVWKRDIPKCSLLVTDNRMRI